MIGCISLMIEKNSNETAKKFLSFIEDNKSLIYSAVL